MTEDRCQAGTPASASSGGTAARLVPVPGGVEGPSPAPAVDGHRRGTAGVEVMNVSLSHRQLDRCRHPSGLFGAVPVDASDALPLYRNMWIRDTVYTLLAYEATGEHDLLRAGAHALLDLVLHRWSHKLDWRIVEGLPAGEVEYLHPRYAPDGSEIHTELWGLRQDDCVGLAVWALSRWHQRIGIFRTDADFHMVQKLVWYCDRINVPHVPDNGIWEEEGATRTVHLSSVAAVAAGLTQAAAIGVKDIPERLVTDTQLALTRMAGRESEHHPTDLALLTLVWPFGDDLPLPRKDMVEVVRRVEEELLGHRGVIRYPQDTYNACHGGPPEWTMGLGFLALAWDVLGDRSAARWYLDRLEASATPGGELPESWCRDPACSRHFNSPLCWSHALHIVAATRLASGVEPALPITLLDERSSA